MSSDQVIRALGAEGYQQFNALQERVPRDMAMDLLEMWQLSNPRRFKALCKQGIAIQLLVQQDFMLENASRMEADPEWGYLVRHEIMQMCGIPLTLKELLGSNTLPISAPIITPPLLKSESKSNSKPSIEEFDKMWDVAVQEREQNGQSKENDQGKPIKLVSDERAAELRILLKAKFSELKEVDDNNIARAKARFKQDMHAESPPEKKAEILADIKSLAAPTFELLTKGKTDWYLTSSYHHSPTGPFIFLSDNDIDSMLSKEALDMYSKELENPGMEKLAACSSKLGVSDMGISDGDLVRIAGYITDSRYHREPYWYARVRDLFTGIATEMKRLGSRKYLVVCDISQTDWDGLMSFSYLIQSLDDFVDAVNYAKEASATLLEIQKSKYFSYCGINLIECDTENIAIRDRPYSDNFEPLYQKKDQLYVDPKITYNAARYYWSVMGHPYKNVLCIDQFKIGRFVCDDSNLYLAKVGAAVRMGEALPNPYNDFSQ